MIGYITSYRVCTGKAVATLSILYMLFVFTSCASSPKPITYERTQELLVEINIAVRENNIERVRELIGTGVDLNAAGPRVNLPLKIAVDKKNYEIAKLMLDNGADPDGIGTKQWSPISTAAINNRPDIVKLLLEHGALSTEEGRRKKNALFLSAVDSLREDMVRLFLDYGADINARTSNTNQNALMLVIDEDYLPMGKRHMSMLELLLENNVRTTSGGYVALIEAARYGKWDAVELLLKYGADPSVADRNGRTVWDTIKAGNVAYSYERAPAFYKLTEMFLYQGADINTDSNFSKNLLNAAIQNGHINIINQLIARGMELDGTKLSSRVLNAAEVGNYDLMRLLLEHGADPNSRYPGSDSGCVQGPGPSALEIAASKGHHEIVKLLIEHGATNDVQKYDLITAASKGETENVKKLLAEGAYIETKVKGYTALLAAAIGGHPETVELLADAGADVSILKESGSGALFEAIKSNNLKAVEILLDAGADPNALTNRCLSLIGFAAQKDNRILRLMLEHGALIVPPRVEDWGCTTAFKAIVYGSNENVNTIIEYGADWSSRNPQDNSTYLMYIAMWSGNIDNARLLLELGADINAADDKGQTALIRAASSYNKDPMVKFLVDNGADIDIVDDSGYSAILHAAYKYNDQSVEYLANAGADVHVIGDDGFSLLGYAAKIGDIELFNELIKAGAAAEIKDASGATPLLYAINSDNKNMGLMVSTLIEKSGDVNAQNGRTWTPLSLAASSDDIELMRTLIEAGADPNGQAGLMDTALTVACRRANFEAFRLLMANGADPLWNNSRPLIAAIKGGDTRIVDELLEKGADPNAINYIPGFPDRGQAILCAASLCRKDMIELLINAGADINVQNRLSNKTALNLAAEAGCTDVVEMLVSKGANVDNRTSQKHTSLYDVSAKGDLEMVKLLVKLGADKNGTNDMGWPPIVAAVRAGHIDIVKYFIRIGADLNIKGILGNKPLHWAIFDRHEDIAILLKEAGAVE